MIEIIVDYNMDQLIVDHGSGTEVRMKVKNPNQLVDILNLVIERIMYRGESVILYKCDEDTKYLVNEW